MPIREVSGLATRSPFSLTLWWVRHSRWMPVDRPSVVVVACTVRISYRQPLPIWTFDERHLFLRHGQVRIPKLRLNDNAVSSGKVGVSANHLSIGITQAVCAGSENRVVLPPSARRSNSREAQYGSTPDFERSGCVCDAKTKPCYPK